MVGGRVDGRTDRMCHMLSDRLYDRFRVNVINVTELELSQCTGCEACRGGNGCVFDDDMSIVLKAFDDADLIVFATPIRFNGPSSQIKTVLDRFQSLWNDSGALAHKSRRMALMMVAGSYTPDPDPNLKIFRSFCASFGGTWLGHAIRSGTDHVDDDGQSTVNELSEMISGSL